METLPTDEIIEEIHAHRLAHAAGFDFDMRRILADLKQSEQARSEAGWPLLRTDGMPSKVESTRPAARFAG